MSKSKHFIELTRRERGVSMESAVAIVAARYERLATAVLDEIGSWPSSEPELRYLQKIYDR